ILLLDTMTKTGESLESSWTDLFTKPSQWQDHRNDKLTGLRSSKCPDFTHMVSSKDSRVGFWLDNVLKWALQKLECQEQKDSKMVGLKVLVTTTPILEIHFIHKFVTLVVLAENI
ncbi:hypothetical protein GIB67_023384, partial [Kingdonia uniflora]